MKSNLDYVMRIEKEKIYGTIETAKLIGIELHRLYCWEQHGVVKPAVKNFRSRNFRRFSEEDIERARFVKHLVDEEGYTLSAAVRKLSDREI